MSLGLVSQEKKKQTVISLDCKNMVELLIIVLEKHYNVIAQLLPLFKNFIQTL